MISYASISKVALDRNCINRIQRNFLTFYQNLNQVFGRKNKTNLCLDAFAFRKSYPQALSAITLTTGWFNLRYAGD